MKKKFITRKRTSIKRVLFLIQTVLILPLLLFLLVVNIISEVALDFWGMYRRWFVGSASDSKHTVK